MVHTLIHNKKSYDLPKRTLDVVRKMDAVVELDQNTSMSLEQKYQHILDFICDILGEKSAEEILGTLELEDIDLSDTLITFRKIVDAYNKPVKDYEHERDFEMLNQLPLDKITKLTRAIESAKTGE